MFVDRQEVDVIEAVACELSRVMNWESDAYTDTSFGLELIAVRVKVGGLEGVSIYQ